MSDQSDNVEYEYEKPIRSTARFNSASWTVAGLVAAGALLSGGAYAMTNPTISTHTQTSNVSAAEVATDDSVIDSSDSGVDQAEENVEESISDDTSDPAQGDLTVDPSGESNLSVPPVVSNGEHHSKSGLSRSSNSSSSDDDGDDEGDHDGDSHEDADDDSSFSTQDSDSHHDESDEVEDDSTAEFED